MKHIKILIFILTFALSIFAQTKFQWLFLGKSTPETSVYVDIGNTETSGDTVKFFGKVEQLTQFTANCKTYEVSATQNGKQTATVKAEPNTFIRKAIAFKIALQRE